MIGLKRVLTKLTYASTPIGTVTAYAGSTAPTGWLLCDGSQIPSQYTKLIELIGTNTPNLTERFIMGAGGELAETGGNKDSIIPYHNHEITDPGHYHQDKYYNANWCASGTRSAVIGNASSSGGSVNNTSSKVTGITINYAGTDGNTENANLPPYQKLNYIIFAG